MATTVAVLEAQLRADNRGFDRAIDKSSRGFSKAGAVIGKAALAAGAAVATGLAVTAKIGFDEFIEGQRVMAQTNAVIKSTGGVANVSAKHVGALAESLMKKSGVDDEVIASGENMLLTFKSIRNEAGKGNKIFDEATKATLDMSVAMGMDMSKAAIMVGKALNDPVRGLTAMRRVGIQFTEAQEDQIKKMVESGDVMGAHKVILKELESQFGGSAEAAGKTFGGQMNILKETFSNTAGEIVGRFIPIIVRVANWLLPKVTQALDFVFEAITGIIAPFTKASETFGSTGNEAYKLGVIIKDVLGGAWQWIKRHIFPIIFDLKDIFMETVQRIGAVLREHEPQLRQIWERVGKALQLLWTVAKPILTILFTEVLPRVIGIAIKVIDKVAFAIEEIIKAGKKVADWFRGSFVTFWKNLWEDVKGLFNRFALWIQEKALRVVLKVLEPFSHLPGKLGGWARDAKDRVNAQLVKIEKQVEDIEEAARRTANRKYNIRFVTNAAKVKSTIEDFRSSLNWTRTPRNVGDFGSFGLGATSLVALGRQLQSMGFQVGEHPAFGGVSGGHVPGSYHYRGRALDINWPGGGAAEMSRLDWLNSRLRRMPGVVELLWRTAGHFDHLHVAMNRGGIVPGRRGAPVPVLAHGGETFIPTHRPGFSAGDTYVLNVPGLMVDGEKVVRWLEKQQEKRKRRGG